MFSAGKPGGEAMITINDLAGGDKRS